MYNLQVASNQFQVLKSTILTASTAVLFYLLTPVYSAELPSQRLQIVVFYFTVLFSLLVWRILYVKFLASNRFVQNVILICENEHLEELVKGLEKADPHYRIIGYVNIEGFISASSFHYVQPIKIYDLVPFVNENSIFEIVVSSQKKKKLQ
jgi:FlaA1/EpsC-like NDP-sugar epimerase